jgi:hypothetical protein
MAAAMVCVEEHTRARVGWLPGHLEGAPMALSLVAAKAVNAARPIPVPPMARMARMAPMVSARVASLRSAN